MSADLKSICEKIKTTKNTALLYNFQGLVEKMLDGKNISNRELIRECLNQLKNLYSAKFEEEFSIFSSKNVKFIL